MAPIVKAFNEPLQSSWKLVFRDSEFYVFANTDLQETHQLAVMAHPTGEELFDQYTPVWTVGDYLIILGSSRMSRETLA